MMDRKRKKNPVAFEFVVDALERLHPEIRPMFGCHALYAGERMLLILRKKDAHRDDNGIFIATTREHHESLKKSFPSIRHIHIFGPTSEWLNLPEDAVDFEEAAFEICRLIMAGDKRIGKVPPARKKRKKPGTSRGN